jgi:hypothetical protein
MREKALELKKRAMFWLNAGEGSENAGNGGKLKTRTWQAIPQLSKRYKRGLLPLLPIKGRFFLILQIKSVR